MKAKYSRLIVVDASVACAAGETQHPVSSSCREALQEILRICHRLIMTPAIRKEWEKHQSGFTVKWRRAMVARKKVERLDPASLPRQSADDLGISSGEHAALGKDILLIEGACAGDGIVVTKDDVIKGIWAKCSTRIKVPKPIRWINPVREGTDCLRNL